MRLPDLRARRLAPLTLTLAAFAAAAAGQSAPPSPRPSPSGKPAPAAAPTPSPEETPRSDPARAAALVAEGESALQQGRLAEAASFFDEALTLDPGNARARAGKARTATSALGLRRTFVPDISSAEGAEGKVKELDDFEVEDLDVKRAARIQGRVELEEAPSRLKPGDTYTIKIYVRNQSRKKKRIIRISELNVHRVVNGADTPVPTSPTVRGVTTIFTTSAPRAHMSA